MSEKYFFYKERGSFKKITLNEIMYLQAEDKYVRFMAKEYNHLVRATLEDVLNYPSTSDFIRIHRSYAISVRYLVEINKETATGLEPSTDNLFELPVSRGYYTAFTKSIGAESDKE